jgi:CheY-like chemotaxis protein/anti-sigma regulatory factor (Ser/Thr protein kinase)
MASPLLEERSHLLHVDVARTGLAVEADCSRLAQILANLLTNAAKYTDPGGKIDVAARDVGEVVEIAVCDNGRGISADMLPYVFDLFVQERQNLDRAAGGLGLGLAIVRNLVELHGGSVSVDSVVGRGSRFVVRLPLARQQSETSGQVASQAPPRVTVAAGNARRVLIVDDNVDAAGLLAQILEALGFATAVAHDGPSALKLAAEYHPHVAVLDIGLPVMDGYELATRIHQVPGLERLPLIAVTGYGQGEDRARSESAGFAAHLTKPVLADDLRRAIDETCPPLARR